MLLPLKSFVSCAIYQIYPVCQRLLRKHICKCIVLKIFSLLYIRHKTEQLNFTIWFMSLYVTSCDRFMCTFPDNVALYVVFGRLTYFVKWTFLRVIFTETKIKNMSFHYLFYKINRFLPCVYRNILLPLSSLTYAMTNKCKVIGSDRWFALIL